MAEERAKCIVQFASFLQNNGLSLMRSMPELFTDVQGGSSPPPAYAAASSGSAGFHAFTSQLAQQQQRQQQQQGRGGPSRGALALFGQVDAWGGSGGTSATRHAVPAAVHGAATVQPSSSMLSSLAFPQASMGARPGASAPIPAKQKQQQLQQQESPMAGLAGEHNNSTIGPKQYIKDGLAVELHGVSHAPTLAHNPSVTAPLLHLPTLLCRLPAPLPSCLLLPRDGVSAAGRV